MSLFNYISSTSTSGGFNYIKFLIIDYIIEPFNNLFNTNIMDDSLVNFT